MTNGYALFAANHWYIMPTEKRKITKYIMADFLRTVAEERGKSQEQIREVLANRQATAELRSLIQPCRFGDSNYTENPIHIECLNRKGEIVMTGNYMENQVTVFEESTEKRIERFLNE